MSGVLKAKVGGIWVPISAAGPQGPAGPAGPAPVKAKAAAFTSSLGGGTLPAGTNWQLDLSTVFLNEGFTKISTVAVAANAAGRYLVSAYLTIVGGVAGNWAIFSIRQLNGATVLRNYEIVGQNTTAGYRAFANAVTLDMNAGESIDICVNIDAGTPSVDGRSWMSISEVAW
jgi:hypothetical protein